MTIFSRMPSQKTTVHHTSPDGELFEVEVEIFETPPEQNYWSVFYRVNHEKYGMLGLYGVLSKEIFSTYEKAKSVYLAQPLDRVKLILNGANQSGFIRQFVLSPDGWCIC
ncbi:hypothetical protein ABRP77_05385 [Pectobacterium odoriferum]|uniref:hypothetical protein n=1 Tax=Pectobacterium odoriferum TaxID=78398 RepID=UPI0032ECF71A